MADADQEPAKEADAPTDDADAPPDDADAPPDDAGAPTADADAPPDDADAPPDDAGALVAASGNDDAADGAGTVPSDGEEQLPAEAVDAATHQATQDDSVPTASGPAAPRRRPLRWAGITLGVLFIAAAAIGTALYFRYWHYTPTAHRHLPEGTNIALRADARELLMFKPVREHLWPVLGRRAVADAVSPSADPARPSRMERIEQRTGFAVADMREVLFASVDGKQWVAIIGGKFPKSGIVTGVHELLREEVPGWALNGELLVHEPTGLAMGQAEDGTLVLGTHTEIARVALPAADDEDTPVPLPVEGAISFLLSSKAWDGALDEVPVKLGGIDTLRAVSEATGTLTLSDKPQLRVVVVPEEGTDPDGLGEAIHGALTSVRRLTIFMAGDLGGAKTALQKAEVSTHEGRVLVTTEWPYEPLDAAVESLAEPWKAREGDRAP